AISFSVIMMLREVLASERPVLYHVSRRVLHVTWSPLGGVWGGDASPVSPFSAALRRRVAAERRKKRVRGGPAALHTSPQGASKVGTGPGGSSTASARPQRMCIARALRRPQAITARTCTRRCAP